MFLIKFMKTVMNYNRSKYIDEIDDIFYIQKHYSFEKKIVYL